MQIERRAFALDGVELRAADGGGQILQWMVTQQEAYA